MEIHGIASASSYSFTNLPWKDLESRGFHLKDLRDQPDQGIQIGGIGFTGTGLLQTLEFINISDEEVFQKSFDSKTIGLSTTHDLLQPQLGLWMDQEPKFNPKEFGLKILNQKKEYDHSNNPAPKVHPNGVHSIIGILMGFTPEQADQFSNKLGFTEKQDFIEFKNKNGIIFSSPLDSEFRSFHQKKEFPFWGVILACNSLDHFCKMANPDRFLNIKGQQAALLQEYSTSWDLLVVESPL